MYLLYFLMMLSVTVFMGFLLVLILGVEKRDRGLVVAGLFGTLLSCLGIGILIVVFANPLLGLTLFFSSFVGIILALWTDC